MEAAANFIGVAATLLLIKSKSLIPDLELSQDGTQVLVKSSFQRPGDPNTYLQANPQVQAELQAITAPGEDLRHRCNVPDEATILGSL
jgi:chromatin segregation and condensation protein Rec8/ScpA/Scc1 (kleisin family)